MPEPTATQLYNAVKAKRVEKKGLGCRILTIPEINSVLEARAEHVPGRGRLMSDLRDEAFEGLAYDCRNAALWLTPGHSELAVRLRAYADAIDAGLAEPAAPAPDEEPPFGGYPEGTGLAAHAELTRRVKALGHELSAAGLGGLALLASRVDQWAHRHLDADQ